MANVNRKARLDFFSEKLLAALLVLLTLIGMACKLLFSLNLNLDSDSVYPGQVSMEFWRHGNYFLQGYYFNSADPHLFSEIFPFHLIPQVLSNYDPTALRLVNFAIFILIVIVFSYIAYRLTGDRIRSLMTAALIANLSPMAYNIYAMPTTHNAVILFAGLLMLLFFDIRKINGYMAVFAIVIATAVAFSDTILMAYFIVPYVIVYLFLIKPKTMRTNLIAAGLFAIPAAAIGYKMLLMPDAMPYAVSVKGAGLLENMRAFIDATVMLLNNSLYTIVVSMGSVGIIDYLVAIAFLAVIGYATIRAFREKNHNLKQFYLFLVASAAITAAGGIFTSLNTGLATARYLTFLALLVFMFISFALTRVKSVYTALMLILLISAVVLNLAAVNSLSYKPNEAEYKLIDHLEANGLTFGYGDYWDANVYTYLSGEKVTILPVLFKDENITPYKWLTCKRWYGQMPDQYFVIVRKNDSNAAFMESYVKSHPALTKAEYENYYIYTFDDRSVYGSWHFETEYGFQKLLSSLEKRGIKLPLFN